MGMVTWVRVKMARSSALTDARAPHIQVQLVIRLRMYFQKAKMPVSSSSNQHRKLTALKHEWYEWPNPSPLQPISL